jgi:hypothetical protein
MSEERTRHGAGFWSTIAAAVVLAYPVGLGPACWLSSRTGKGAAAVSTLYRPLLVTVEKSSSVVGPDCRRFLDNAVDAYAQWGAAKHWQWARPNTGFSMEDGINLEMVWYEDHFWSLLDPQLLCD